MTRVTGDGAQGGWLSLNMIAASATGRPLAWVVTAWRSDARGRIKRSSLSVVARRSYEDEQRFTARYNGTVNELFMQVMEGAI